MGSGGGGGGGGGDGGRRCRHLYGGGGGGGGDGGCRCRLRLSLSPFVPCCLESQHVHQDRLELTCVVWDSMQVKAWLRLTGESTRELAKDQDGLGLTCVVWTTHTSCKMSLCNC